MNKFFKLDERNTTIKTEILAGITTFLSMSYILIVNPLTLSDAGMDFGAVFTATIISATIGCLIMGLYANYPVAQAAGLGINSFFTYTVVLSMGYTWEMALFAIFVSGLIFILLSLTGLRETIINAIPKSLKYATSAGIGFFIAFIGLQTSGIVVDNPATLVGLGDLTSPPVLLTLLGLLLMMFFHARGNKFSIIIVMVTCTLLGMLLNIFGIDTGIHIPEAIVSMPPSIEPVFAKLFTDVDILFLLTDVTFWTVVFSFLFVDFFDTTGTLVAVGSEAGLLDEDGNIIDSKKALLSDSVATTIGAVVGTSSVTSYIESLSGIKLGGRTGLTAVTVAACFLLALFFAPLLSIVTSSITAPALIMVGTLMAVNKAKINYDDFADSAGAFITMLMMIVAYSVAEGIAFGFLTYTFIKLAQGKYKEIHPVLYAINIIFIVHLTSIKLAIVAVVLVGLYIAYMKYIAKK